MTNQYYGKDGPGLNNELRAAERVRAAAPELLEALKDCVTMLKVHDDESYAIDKARAAIAKAEGRQ